MVLPFETVSVEDRRVERERQRRLVFALSRSDPTADCLAAMATNLLDHQFRLEDAVLAAAASLFLVCRRCYIMYSFYLPSQL